MTDERYLEEALSYRWNSDYRDEEQDGVPKDWVGRTRLHFEENEDGDTICLIYDGEEEKEWLSSDMFIELSNAT